VPGLKGGTLAAALNVGGGDLAAVSKPLLMAMGTVLPGGRVLDDVYRLCTAMLAVEANPDTEAGGGMCAGCGVRGVGCGVDIGVQGLGLRLRAQGFGFRV
jgi:hypothetical protein